MDRRSFLKTSLAALVAVVLGPTLCSEKNTEDEATLVSVETWPWSDSHSRAYRMMESGLVFGVKIDPEWNTASMGNRGMVDLKTARATIYYKSPQSIIREREYERAILGAARAYYPC